MSKKAKADTESSTGKSPPTSKACRHWLEKIGRASGRACLVPLPTTRELGEQFRLSHGTVARILQDMRDRELLWQHPESGRFYPAQAAKVLGRPKPLAVVLRHMQAWSALCRDVMIGFTEECARQEIPILLLHCGGLLHEDNPGSGSAVVATTSVQKRLLAEIHLRYGDLVDGYFLDELWKDEAIASSIPKATRVSTFYRKTSLPHVSSATVDYTKDALQALSQLFARGCQRILLVNPHPDYAAAHQFLTEVRTVYKNLKGEDLPENHDVLLYRPDAMNGLIASLSKTRTPPTGIIVPEDNAALLLHRHLSESVATYGKKHHLIATMGSSQIPLDSDIPVLRHDFAELGRSGARNLIRTSHPD